MIELLRQNIRVVGVIVVVVALLIVNVMFYLQWQSVQDTQDKLQGDKELAEVRKQNANTEYDVSRLRAEEAALLGKPEFPTEFPILDLSRYLARGEDIYRVDILEMGPSSARTEPIGGKTYPAYETEITVRGELTKIISFLEYVEEGPYTSIRVKDVEFSGSGESWKGEFTIVFITQR